MLETQEGFQKIGTIAKNLGVSVSSVRYYEDLGIIRAKRTDSGYRIFAPGTERLLRLVLDAKELGFTLKEIKALALTLQQGRLSKQEVQCRLQQKLQELDERIKKIRTFQKNVKKVLSQPCPNEGWWTAT